MSDILPFLKEMISVPGLSGHEGPVREIITAKWSTLTDEMKVSPLGSLEGLVKGSGPEPRHSILLAGHMDAIGMMATGMVDGLIRFTQIGGVDPRILPGQPVTVHGRQDLPGEVVQPPASLLPEEIKDAPVPMEYLFVDTGLEPAEVSRLVHVGDLISFAQAPFELSGSTLAGHTMDDRTAVAAITICLEELQSRKHSWDVWAVATVQEEVSYGGSYTSSYGINPDIGIAIDVTHAKGPGTSDAKIAPLGKGASIGLGPNIHNYLYKELKAVAEDLEIPFHIDTDPTHSGTDAYAIQVTMEGKPSAVLSIPLRYMHTPVEMVAMKDIKRVGRILAEFITRLGPDYLEKINWDD